MRAKVYERIIGLLIEDKEFQRMYRRNPVAAVSKYGIVINRSEIAELTNHHKG